MDLLIIIQAVFAILGINIALVLGLAGFGLFLMFLIAREVG